MTLALVQPYTEAAGREGLAGSAMEKLIARQIGEQNMVNLPENLANESDKPMKGKGNVPMYHKFAHPSVSIGNSARIFIYFTMGWRTRRRRDWHKLAHWTHKLARLRRMAAIALKQTIVPRGLSGRSAGDAVEKLVGMFCSTGRLGGCRGNSNMFDARTFGIFSQPPSSRPSRG
ncbi:hypothetical protein O4H48_22345 [Rhodobacteraceae bacterium G21628-S1]|nr:hypothetical protein [Rhodobacteraceae bacterium G21628-S1]